MIDKIEAAFSTRRGMIITGAVLAAVYFSPYLIKGQGAFVLIHDNLDQINRIAGLENGRVNTLSLSPDRVLFYLFGYFTGFVINEMLYRLIGGIGMFLLLARLDDAGRYPRYFLFLASAGFAALPFWPQGNLSVAGIPLLIWLFINLYQRRLVRRSLVVLFVFPLYSSLALSGVFFLFLATLVTIYLGAKRKPVKHVVIGIACLSAGYVVFQFEILNVLRDTQSGESTRSLMQLSRLRAKDALETLHIVYRHFLDSQYHAATLHKWIILPSSGIALAYLLVKKQLASPKRIAFIAGYLVVSSFIFGLRYFRPTIQAYEQLGLGFNFSRFYFLNPALWFILWTLLLANVYRATPRKRLAGAIILVLLAAQLGIGFKHYTCRGWADTPSFEAFMAVGQFDAIKKQIALAPGDQIGCIGFYPAVANYNGLDTFGFYKAFYAKDLKQKIYAVIKPELEQNPKLHNYFRYWGSRAYLYDDIIAKHFTDQAYIKKHIPEITCDLNLSALRAAGVTYLFSTAKIANADQRGLRFVTENGSPRDYYRFFVYEMPGD